MSLRTKKTGERPPIGGSVPPRESQHDLLGFAYDCHRPCPPEVTRLEPETLGLAKVSHESFPEAGRDMIKIALGALQILNLR